jgi:hypothetical protein
MPSLVLYARSLALTFRSLTPREIRLRRIHDYLRAGLPSRRAVPASSEAEIVQKNFFKLVDSGYPPALLPAPVCRKAPLPTANSPARHRAASRYRHRGRPS